MAGSFCNRCGHENPPGARFCSSCGERLRPEADDRTQGFDPIEAAEQENRAAEVSGYLVVTRGHRSGVRFPLTGENATAGRHPESDVFLDDITVSRRHVEIRRVGDHHVIRDVGSLNGTYVNAERVEEAVLSDGDEVQIGKFKLVYIEESGGSTE
ncbi:MAG TPA: FHA domain-containing protein [Acidimicrobiales bacterium]|nr:FHA domain-containing protein [Acidimicrobiales bacterium]